MLYHKKVKAQGLHVQDLQPKNLEISQKLPRFTLPAPIHGLYNMPSFLSEPARGVATKF